MSSKLKNEQTLRDTFWEILEKKIQAGSKKKYMKFRSPLFNSDFF